MAEAEDYRCFIGGLSWSTSDGSLKDAFEKFGHLVEARVVLDRYSGRSRGFGFVTFDDEKSMEDAIRAMDGMSLDGRSITVDRAQQAHSGRDRGGDRDRDYERDRDRGRDRGGRDRDSGRSYGGSNSGGCYNCGQQGHFARECPSGDRSDKYNGRDSRSGGGGRYGSDRGGDRYGPDRNGGDRYGGRSKDSGSRGGSGGDRYTRDRSGPYERPSGGGH